MQRVAWIVVLVIACTKAELTTPQYERTNADLMTAITAVFASAGKDCAKLATGVDAFMARHKPDMEAVVAFEAAHPDERASYELATGLELERAFGKAATPGLEACADDKQFQDAWSRFTK